MAGYLQGMQAITVDVATAGGVVGGLFQLLGKALTYLRNRDRQGSWNNPGQNPKSLRKKERETKLRPW